MLRSRSSSGSMPSASAIMSICDSQAKFACGPDDANPRGRQLEDLGQRALDLEGQLRVRPDRDLAGRIPRRDRGPGLRVALVDDRRPEAVLEDVVGFLETPLDVARDDDGAVTDV